MSTGYLVINMHMENVQILGFRASINSIGETLDLIDSIKKEGEIIQLLNADSIASKDHIIHGVNQAFLAFERGENLAKDISVEIVLRCSAQRQISKAFDILGLKEGDMNIAVVLIDCPDYFIDELSDMFVRNDAVLEADESILTNLYDIPEKELKNIQITDILIDKTTRLIVEQ